MQLGGPGKANWWQGPQDDGGLGPGKIQLGRRQLRLELGAGQIGLRLGRIYVGGVGVTSTEEPDVNQ